MEDPGNICWPVSLLSLAMTVFFSFLKNSLLNVSWPRLEDALEESNDEAKLEYIRNKISKLVISANLISLSFSLIFAITIVIWQISNIDDLNSLGFKNLLLIFVTCFFSLSIFHIALPEMLASCWGTGIIVFSFPVLKYIEIFLSPIIFLLFCIESVLEKMAGITDESSPEQIEKKQEELLSIVEEGEKEGYVDEEQRDMIESVFEFQDTTAGEIMTPRTEMSSINLELRFDDVVTFIIKEGHSRYPVYIDNIDNITGMLYAKDLLQYVGCPDRPQSIEAILREAFFVPGTKSLQDLLHDFKEKKVHVAIVLDEYGGTAGLVSFEDILEEIVGEIEDEHEHPRSEPVKIIDDNTFEVDARTEIHDLNDQYTFKLPEDEDYETLGGFAFSQLGHIPMVGETFTYNGYTFTVIDAERRKIIRLKIEIIEQEHDSQEI